MKLGIFGGTFNPIHQGHLAIAEAAEKQFDLEQILFVPACLPPHKQEPDLAPAADRVAMVNLTLKGHPRWACDERELRRGGASYTVETLESIHRDHSGAALFLILGSDNLLSFGRWKQPARVAELAELLIYARPGSPLPADPEKFTCSLGFPLKFHTIAGAEMKIAATDIRDRIRRKKNASELVPPGVLAYIQTHKLYQ